MRTLPVVFLALSLASCREPVNQKDTDDPQEDDSAPPTTSDADGDGWDAPADCDDTDPNVYPGANEYCDDVDNNCNGLVDDDASDAPTWYGDADRDGFGGDQFVVEQCDAPDGYAADGGDCNDLDADSYPNAEEVCDGADNDCDGSVDEDDATDAYTWYYDGDGDGFGVDSDTVEGCDAPRDYTAHGGDCDDTDAAFHPGALEADCADANDYNCDGSVGYADADGDGFAACEDCDDTEASANPDGTEVCDDIDNDCDGSTDDDATDASTWYLDADGDGFGGSQVSVEACEAPAGFGSDSTDCDDLDASSFPGGAEICDDADNDCDGTADEGVGTTWYADADGDGYGDAASSTDACEAPVSHVANGDDCDDDSASTSPAAYEICDNADNDCDGQTDEDAINAGTFYADSDGDGYGDASTLTTACSAPSGYTTDGSDCDDSDGSSTHTGQDGDCDGILTGDDCDDADASSSAVSQDGDCDGILTADDCDDGDPASNAIADDGDCDGALTADDCDDTDPASTLVASDADCDGFLAAVDCNDNNSAVFPGATEVASDGVDSDCDGFDDPQHFSGSIEMPAGGTINGYSEGTTPWSAINSGGGRAVTRITLTESCENPELALFQHANSDTSIQGAYYITDGNGTVLDETSYETYSGCNNCWLPHNQRLSVTLAVNTFYFVGYMNQGGDMSGPSVYEDSSARTVGIATFDSPFSDLVATVGLPPTAVNWQNRWRIDCE